MKWGITRIHALVPRKSRDYGGKGTRARRARASRLPGAPGVRGSRRRGRRVPRIAPRARREARRASRDSFLEVARVEAITTRILSTPLPPDFERALDACFEELVREGADAVAVRSSSTVEDQEEASAAGLHASILHVTTTAALHDAVRACWASLYSERVLAYLRVAGRGGGLRWVSSSSRWFPRTSRGSSSR